MLNTSHIQTICFIFRSSALSNWNALYTASIDILRSKGVQESEAIEIAREALANFNSKGTMSETLRMSNEMCNENAAISCDSESKFRTINGQCNNLVNKRWGSMGIQLRRSLAGISNLFSVPTSPNANIKAGAPSLGGIKYFGLENTCSCSTAKCVTNFPVERPDPRTVSSGFFTGDNRPKNDLTLIFAVFGQFLDHDLTFTPEEEECGCGSNPSRDMCYPIRVDQDSFYKQQNVKCLDFGRSMKFCSKDEQMNAITAFLDASSVYGSDKAMSDNLRTLNGGKLKLDGNELLPLLQMGESQDSMESFQSPPEQTKPERTAGDGRATEWPGLVSMHTLFAREHNRICDQLALHPNVDATWTDEDFFQNARRILIAEWQAMIYRDWLPILLGQNWDYFLPKRYESNLDPSISNSFATAAFRFGHSLIQGEVLKKGGTKNFDLRTEFFETRKYDAAGGFKEIIEGLVSQSAQNFDRHVSEDLTNHLFANVASRSSGGSGSDLVSRNIQRGRDHGLPSYAAFYKKYAPYDPNSSMDCWDKKPAQIDWSNWNLLKGIYKHPHHIDLFVGGFAEKPYNGGLVGATFHGIIKDQFHRLRNGDRFFYTHAGVMNTQELDQVRKRSLQGIICDNTNVQRVARNPFYSVSFTNGAWYCSQIEKMDIKKFQDFKKGNDNVDTG